MKDTHLSEMEIQEYAINGNGARDAMEHIPHCPECLTVLKNYQLLFGRIKNEPPASLDVDLSALVIARLPQSPSTVLADRFITGFLLVFIASFIATPVVLFRQNIENVFAGITPLFIYAGAGALIILLSYQALEMYKKFRKQMQYLNYN